MSLDSLLMYWYVKIYVNFSAFVLTTTGSDILFNAKAKEKQMEIACSVLNNSPSLSMVDNSLAHKFRVTACSCQATFKCNTCPTSCIEISL